MAASFTSLLRLLLQETYSNPETWGEEQNAGLVRMIDEAFGLVAITVDDNVTLTTQNGVSDQARRMALLLTGAGGFNVVAPALGKLYLVINNCAANVTLKTSVTAGVSIRAGTAVWAYYDGTDWALVDPTLDKIKPPVASVDLNGQKLVNAAPGTDNTDVATLAQLKPFADDAEAAAIIATQALEDVMAISLGAHAVDPTTDNDGNPLVTGTIYFNTIAGELRVWNGAAWQGGVTDTGNLVAKWTYSTITSNTTAVNGTAYIANTAGGAFTLTLPASASAGVRVGVIAPSSVETNALTINPNSQTFDGATTNFTVGAPCTLVFVKIGTEWRLEP